MKAISFLALGIQLASVAIADCQGIEWTIVNWKVRHDFPEIRRIDPKQVAHWLNDSRRAPPALLDVRTKAEYEVSHIDGAKRVEPSASIETINLPREKPVVTYCSVGYRSAAFAKKLQAAGYKNVQNMTGSIFAWANAGYPIERNGERAEKVLPYSNTWASLLKPSLRANVPAVGAGM